MILDDKKFLSLSVAILAAWSAFLLMAHSAIGVSWFSIGDFDYRTAMAYHGLLIPAWMMLVIAYLRQIGAAAFSLKLLEISALCAAVFTGIGSLIISDQGFSFGIVITITGMVLAEMTALIIIVESLLFFIKMKPKGIDPVAFWTVWIALIGVSLATPLGHLVGAAHDLEAKLPAVINFFGLNSDEAVDGFLGSHSHQVLAAFLAVSFSLPLLRKPISKNNIVRFVGKGGLLLILFSTISQVLLYQYSAWIGWEPPELFVKGPNGMPGDDFVLSVLGVGMLLLIPALLQKKSDRDSSKNSDFSLKISVVIAILAYIISIVVLGVFIEFNEQFFGHGEGSAPGVFNDMAYIRAHMIFGFIIIPLLLSAFLNLHFFNSKNERILIFSMFVLSVVTGAAGVFLWTFYLSSLLIKISFALTAISLALFAFQLFQASRIDLKF